MGVNARHCSPERRCYADDCETCDALPCHHVASVARHWQPACELGPGHHYWQITAPGIGSLGTCDSEREARKVAAAYCDPKATRRSVLNARRLARWE